MSESKSKELLSNLKQQCECAVLSGTCSAQRWQILFEVACVDGWTGRGQLHLKPCARPSPELPLTPALWTRHSCPNSFSPSAAFLLPPHRPSPPPHSFPQPPSLRRQPHVHTIPGQAQADLTWQAFSIASLNSLHKLLQTSYVQPDPKTYCTSVKMLLIFDFK